MESLRLQLNRQTTEKDKLMRMMSECQEELAHTVSPYLHIDHSYVELAANLLACSQLRQLSTCEEDCNRKKHLTTQTKLSFQLKLDKLHEEHAQALLRLETQLRVKEKLVEEFETFTKVSSKLFHVTVDGHMSIALSCLQSLAAELELQQFSKKQQKGKEKECVGVISTRAREIARSALNLSDFELDEFFSDIEVKLYTNGIMHYI